MYRKQNKEDIIRLSVMAIRMEKRGHMLMHRMFCPVTDTDAIAELCKKERVDGIITSFSDLLMECMVKIAAKADLPMLSETRADSVVPRQIRVPSDTLEAWASDTGLCENTGKSVLRTG